MVYRRSREVVLLPLAPIRSEDDDNDDDDDDDVRCTGFIRLLYDGSW